MEKSGVEPGTQYGQQLPSLLRMVNYAASGWLLPLPGPWSLSPECV